MKDDPSSVASSSHIAGTCSPNISSSLSSMDWILDSGASAYVCYSRESFFNIKPAVGASISLSDQSRIIVDYCGGVRISYDLILHNVLFVPTFRFNLISVISFISSMPVRVSFTDNSCLIQASSLQG